MSHYAGKVLLRKALEQAVEERERAIQLAAEYKEALTYQSMACGLLRLQLQVAGINPAI